MSATPAVQSGAQAQPASQRANNHDIDNNNNNNNNYIIINII